MPRTTRKAIAAYWAEDRPIPGSDYYPMVDLCFACQWPHSGPLERAHVIPDAKGGADEPSNLILLCHECHIKQPDVISPEVTWRWLANREQHVPEPIRRVEHLGTLVSAAAYTRFMSLLDRFSVDDALALVMAAYVAAHEELQPVNHAYSGVYYSDETTRALLERASELVLGYAEDPDQHLAAGREELADLDHWQGFSLHEVARVTWPGRGRMQPPDLPGGPGAPDPARVPGPGLLACPCGSRERGRAIPGLGLAPPRHPRT